MKLPWLLLLVTSCTVDAAKTVRTDCPSRAEFDAVSPVLEERCGTLDCHGQLYRPLRVYSALGMRLGNDPSAFSPGTEIYPDAFPTTDLERDATRRSLCALEPEVMASVQAGDLDANELTVVRKAKGTEKHKGGVVFHDGDGAERCLVGWIEGKTDSDLCASALDAAP